MIIPSTRLHNIFDDDPFFIKVTQKSLRQRIGVVPQDTVLFNNDIRLEVILKFFLVCDERADRQVG